MKVEQSECRCLCELLWRPAWLELKLSLGYPRGSDPREEYRAQKGGRLPRGIFLHIIGYWRSSRDYLGPAPDGA